jgi:hypothetical protein
VSAKARCEFRRRTKSEREIRAFARWRDERLREVTDRYYALSRAGLRAARALVSGALTPEEQDLAWSAIAASAMKKRASARLLIF